MIFILVNSSIHDHYTIPFWLYLSHSAEMWMLWLSQANLSSWVLVQLFGWRFNATFWVNNSIQIQWKVESHQQRYDSSGLREGINKRSQVLPRFTSSVSLCANFFLSNCIFFLHTSSMWGASEVKERGRSSRSRCPRYVQCHGKLNRKAGQIKAAKQIFTVCVYLPKARETLSQPQMLKNDFPSRYPLQCQMMVRTHQSRLHHPKESATFEEANKLITLLQNCN